MPTLTNIWWRLDGLMKKRIPTILGLVVLVLGVIGGVLLVGEGTGGFLPRASEEATPQKVRITNITDSSFSVSFITAKPAIGLVEYGLQSGKYNDQVLDDRDQITGSSGQYQTHHITVNGLQPGTQYYFRIGTGPRLFFDNNGTPFDVRTARASSTQSSAQVVSGVVKNQAGNPAGGALIYLTSLGASPVSSYVKNDGSWSIALSKVRSQDLSALFEFSDTTTLQVQVIDSTAQTLNASTNYANLAELKQLQFGQEGPTASTNSDSTNSESMASEDSNSTSDSLNSSQPRNNSLDGLLTEDEKAGAMETTTVNITYPRQDQEVVGSTQPELAGKAPAGSVLQIEVHSETAYYDVVEASADGSWNWSPPADLEPGEHTMTVRYTDEDGVQHEESRTFIVLADTSSSLAFVSTPSGSVASPKPSPVPSPTPTPKASPLPSPVASPKPSPLPSSKPATMSAQPVSGSTTPLVLTSGLSFFLIGLGGTWAWNRHTARKDQI